MSQVLLLNSTEHGHQGWKPVRTFEFAARFAMVPVGLHELSALLPIYPLALHRAQVGAPLQLVALTGVQPGLNLFVAAAGRWIAPYVPQGLVLYPFGLQPQAGHEGQFSVLFNQASGALREQPQAAQGEHRFFDAAGAYSPEFARVVEGLQQVLRGQRLALWASSALEAQGVLEPWPGARASGGADAVVDGTVGLFRVNEAALGALPPEALKALQQAHALPLAYAQLLSQGRMEVLNRLAALYARQAQEAAAAAAASLPDPGVVQRLFEPGQPDTLQFNW